MKTYKTEQESFWAGEFGDDYIKRNHDSKLLASNLHLFAKILSKSSGVSSVLELGANIGLNLVALHDLLPEASFSAVEINKKACEELRNKVWIDVINKSILEFEAEKKYDLVFSKGVLIHINPESLEAVYKKLYDYSQKYILIVEYYNPVPLQIDYRGNSDKLFKRDFCSEIVSLYPDLTIVDYGFSYHLDPIFPQDDLTWFLLKK